MKSITYLTILVIAAMIAPLLAALLVGGWLLVTAPMLFGVVFVSGAAIALLKYSVGYALLFAGVAACAYAYYLQNKANLETADTAAFKALSNEVK